MMKSMRVMHDRMTAAKTAEELAQLMQVHMMFMHPGTDMIEMMTQMMMDREAAQPPASM